MRLVLDTNTVVSAILWEGAPKSLFTEIRGRGIALFTSPPLIAELADILSRRKFDKQLAAARLSSKQVLDSYLRSATSVSPAPTPRIVSDPDDDVVIGTALAAKAHLIVTGDRALLSIAEYQGVGIVSVIDALRILGLGLTTWSDDAI
jgi:putative PIN family toxin of toxin-antitoxin system